MTPIRILALLFWVAGRNMSAATASNEHRVNTE